MRKLKVGDKVNMWDGSYCFGIQNGLYRVHCDCYNGDREGLTVVKTGLKVMKNECGDRDGVYTQVCDILVTNGNGGFWFTQSRFVKLANVHTIVIDGKTVEVSEELFENLKRSLL